MDELVFNVSDFVAVFNQTISFAYPSVTIEGELDNFRISKQRWVYLNLKDEYSSVKFFGTVMQLPGPLEDGLMLRIRGVPFLHPQYGFSINVQFIQPVGEGSLKKAAKLLEVKLTAEGLFDESRKRVLDYPPDRVGLITSSEAAAYKDFLKVLGQRWPAIKISFYNVQVQGEAAIGDISTALNYFNAHKDPVDVIVITRGGGSPDDLAIFDSEAITRAIATSRIPTLVAIGHERDVSLAEMAADRRASTPSNAAELLAPERSGVIQELEGYKNYLNESLDTKLTYQAEKILLAKLDLDNILNQYLISFTAEIDSSKNILSALSPQNIIDRGYAVIRKGGKVLKSIQGIKIQDNLSVELRDGDMAAVVKDLKLK